MDGLKYKYPGDIKDSLSRKKFRQQVRGKYKTLMSSMHKAKKEYGKESDEYLDVRKRFKKFCKKYLTED